MIYKHFAKLKSSSTLPVLRLSSIVLWYSNVSDCDRLRGLILVLLAWVLGCWQKNIGSIAGLKYHTHTHTHTHKQTKEN